MSDQGDDFYVTLPAAASLDYYPDNVLSNYTTHLHTPIDLERYKYKVALVEMQISAPVLNINSTNNTIQTTFIKKGKPEEEIEEFGEGRFFEHKIRESYYHTSESVMKAINIALKSSNFEISFKKKEKDAAPRRHGGIA